MSAVASLGELKQVVMRQLTFLRLKPFDNATEEGRSKERYRLIALAAASGVAAKVLATIVGLVSVPLTIHYLGKDQFGLWMAVSSLAVWMQLTDLGLGSGLNNALAEAHGRQDDRATKEYLSTAFVASGVLALGCFLLIAVVATVIPWDRLLNIGDSHLAVLARDSFIVMGALFAINSPLSIATRVLIAKQKSYIANFVQILASILSLTGLILAVNLKLDLVPLVLTVTLGPVAANLAAWLLLIRSDRTLIPARHSIRKSALRRVARSSAPLFLFQIGALMVGQLVNVVLAHLGSLRMVADYNIVLKVYLLVFAIGLSVSAPFYPAIREAFERHETAWISRAISRTISIRICSMLPAALILLFFGDRLVLLWTRTQFENSFGLLGWMAVLLSLVLAGLSSTLSEILTSLDRIWPQIVIVFLSAASVIAGMYLLVPSLGVPGVFFSMALSTLYPIIWSRKQLNGSLKQGSR